jgi:hypothetical protein
VLHEYLSRLPRLKGPLAAARRPIILVVAASVCAGLLSALPAGIIASVPSPSGGAVLSPPAQDGPAPAESRDVPRRLVKVHVSTPEGWRLLRSLGAELYLRGDGYAVVRLKAEALSSLDSHALSWVELSREYPHSLFYLIPERGSPPVGSYDVRVLDSDRDGFIVEASPQAAADAVADGYKAMPLDRTWPISPAGFSDLDFIHEVVEPNDEIQGLLGLVSPDSLGANIQHLEDYGTRYIQSPQTIKAARWLVRRLLQFGYADTLMQTVTIDKKVSLAPPNVAATKPGTDRPQFRIIVGGHYDSIISNTTTSPMTSAPGANDNGSGTAATLEIARVLADVPLDATVQFVLFTAEEIGLLGSSQFAAQMVGDGVPADKAFVINMDMIANADSKPWRVLLYYDIPSLPLAEFAERIGEAYTSLQPLMAGYSARSDHVPFQQAGYKAIFVNEAGQDPHYHSVNDRLAYLEMDYMAEVVRMVTAMVLHLARVAEPPDALTAMETESGRLSVEWNHSTDADVLRYHVEFLDDEGTLVASYATQDNRAVFDPDNLGDASWVRVRAEDVLGESEPSRALLISAGKLLVRGTSPNPARSQCNFDIFIPGAGDPVNASLQIFDASGRLVRSIENRNLPRGSHILQWDTRGDDGPVPSGIYFYAMRVDGVGVDQGKVVVVR